MLRKKKDIPSSEAKYNTDTIVLNLKDAWINTRFPASKEQQFIQFTYLYRKTYMFSKTKVGFVWFWLSAEVLLNIYLFIYFAFGGNILIADFSCQLN